ncbi:MAG: flippase-like domain-containing protein [Candidatus Cloacimonetes bacterium]|nr:flippase-like domain-containing protein [Candidatus Cloacimonadota bacterium]
MDKLKKSRLFYIVKILITLMILYFIFKKINIHQLLSNFKNIGFGTVIVLLITAAIKYLIRFHNWGKYLKINPNYKPKRYEVIKSTFIGTALQFLLPGGYGTFGKMYYVQNEKSATFISVSLEKFFLTWINLSAASFAAIFYFKQFSMTMKISVFIVMILLPFILFFANIFIKNKKYNKFIEYYKAYKRITPQIIILHIIYIVITFFQYYVIINHFSSISFFRIIITSPLVIVANVIPISYSGLGLRETFALEVFSKYGIVSEIILTATLSIFFFNTILPAICGLVIILKKKN